ncbi:MAG: chondroitin lyase, partial [Gammaproteobacteria bacterium]|nr:chondroitin lyase [Gammaproteobacteria bacterium]
NEHIWLLYASLGYSCISSWLSEEQRSHIIVNLFQPMLDMFTVKYDYDFDRIHNHGLWAVAAVGICGLAIGEDKYVDMSVNGLDGTAETGGFLAQLNNLFAPSGYYMEGPYYHAFAITPVCLFAEALHRHRPELDILNHKHGVIGTTIQALLATAYPNGQFPALNDASRTKNTSDTGVLIAVGLCFKHYSQDAVLQGMAKIQQRVWLHPNGLALSRAVAKAGKVKSPHWQSVQLSDGPQGDRGAHAFLRMNGDHGETSQLVMNFGQHGEGHGHFDALGISLFNRGQVVLQDYGFCRWVNVEPKFGGRYLAENQGFARQTIAHNLVAVDEQCQNAGDVSRADAKWGTPHFFIGDSDKLQAVSAFADDFYTGVEQQRSILMLKIPELPEPLLIDLFRLGSQQTHQYDYSLQLDGQFIDANFEVHQNTELHPLGSSCGYQHLWDVSRGKPDGHARISWLQGSSFYTWRGACGPNAEVIFTRVGANDPEFNLRSESGIILRQRGSNHLFASVLETHGYFSEASEVCTDATSKLSDIRIIGSNSVGSVVEIIGLEFSLIIMLSNQRDVTQDTLHEIEFDNKTFSWEGYMAVTQGGIQS